MVGPLPRRVVGICVGVDKPGLLHELKAAGSGAKQFHDWLLSQKQFGVDVHSDLFTGAVSRKAILKAVSQVLKKGGCDVLYIYLAGHGVALTATEERLLLSDASEDGAEAIALDTIVKKSPYCGIPHVIIIWDACRSYANTDQLREIVGGPIFPPGAPYKGSAGRVDLFMACAPGDASYEVAKVLKPTPKQFRALFTNALVEKLKKPAPQLLVKATIGRNTAAIIPSHLLADELITTVPLLALQSKPSFTQIPDIKPGSYPPKQFFGFAPPATRAPVAKRRFAKKRIGGGGSARRSAAPVAKRRFAKKPLGGGGSARRSATKSTQAAIRDAVAAHKKTWQYMKALPSRAATVAIPSTSDVARMQLSRAFGTRGPSNVPNAALTTMVAQKSGFNLARERMHRAVGIRGFETHCGFTVVGAGVRSFTLSHGQHHERWSSGSREQHIRVGQDSWDARGGTALLQFKDGTGMALAVMPGYVGTVLVEGGAVRAIAYAPASGTREFRHYDRRRKQTEEQRATAAAAASVGQLAQLARVGGGGSSLASFLRREKSRDPCLGVLAAYAYHLANDHPQVLDIWRWMSNTEVQGFGVPKRVFAPVPFDVAMLAGKLTPALVQRTPGIAPFCPWLSFGWTLLDDFNVTLHPALVEASRNRLPGTWTSFSERGMGALREAFLAGEIL